MEETPTGPDLLPRRPNFTFILPFGDLDSFISIYYMVVNQDSINETEIKSNSSELSALFKDESCCYWSRLLSFSVFLSKPINCRHLRFVKKSKTPQCPHFITAIFSNVGFNSKSFLFTFKVLLNYYNSTIFLYYRSTSPLRLSEQDVQTRCDWASLVLWRRVF